MNPTAPVCAWKSAPARGTQTPGQRDRQQRICLVTRVSTDVVLLMPPVEARHAAVFALLADGESWPSSALALALGNSQRSVQRALDTLATAGKVQSFVTAGHGAG
jgi:beta-phosphoglucomutase-like phosphatase (HAD superfamily)